MLKTTDRGVRVNCDVDFNWSELAAGIPVLADWGLNLIYLNPIMQSCGRPDGYRITNPASLNSYCQGDEGWEVLTTALRAHGFSIIIDTAHHVYEGAPGDVLALTDPNSRYLDFGDMKRVLLENPGIRENWLGFQIGIIRKLEAAGIPTAVRLDFADGAKDLPGLAAYIKEQLPATTFIIEHTRDPHETYPTGIDGDTGQWFRNAMVRALSDETGTLSLLNYYGRYTSEPTSFAEVVRGGKIEHFYTFAPEIEALHQLATFLVAGIELADIQNSLIENKSVLPPELLNDAAFMAEWRLVSVKIETKGWVTASHRHFANPAFIEGGLVPNSPHIDREFLYDLIRDHFQRTPLGLLELWTHDHYSSADAAAWALALGEHYPSFLELMEQLGPVFVKLAPGLPPRVLWTIMVTLIRCPTATLEGLVGTDKQDDIGYLAKWCRETIDLSHWSWKERGWFINHELENLIRKGVTNLWNSQEFLIPFNAFLDELSETGRWISLTQHFTQLLLGGISMAYQAKLGWAFFVEDPHNRFTPDLSELLEQLNVVLRGGQPTVAKFRLGEPTADTTKPHLYYQALQLVQQFSADFSQAPTPIPHLPSGRAGWRLGDLEFHIALNPWAVRDTPQPGEGMQTLLPAFAQFGLAVFAPVVQGQLATTAATDLLTA